MENGLRAMNIDSLNPESTQEEQMQRDIIKNLTRNKIHISSIQETRIVKDRDLLRGNYRVITAAAAKRAEARVAQGGTSIMIHGSMHQYITHVARQSRRVLSVTMGSGNSNMPIHILTAYAPRNGRTE